MFAQLNNETPSSYLSELWRIQPFQYFCIVCKFLFLLFPSTSLVARHSKSGRVLFCIFYMWSPSCLAIFQVITKMVKWFLTRRSSRCQKILQIKSTVIFSFFDSRRNLIINFGVSMKISLKIVFCKDIIVTLFCEEFISLTV